MQDERLLEGEPRCHPCLCIPTDPLGQGQRPSFPGGNFETIVEAFTRTFMVLSRLERQEVGGEGWESLLLSNSHIL